MSQSANGVYTPTMTSIIVNNTALKTPAGGDEKRNWFCGDDLTVPTIIII